MLNEYRKQVKKRILMITKELKIHEKGIISLSGKQIYLTFVKKGQIVNRKLQKYHPRGNGLT